ncbi:hypothetical protein [Sphingobacterium tabacisoli]|uniref:Uncharacterized protein n=1 Tax=Sphingobacterium tabacisoli TaxID=2044855 RepID=A0ABW5L9B5_9SPHI|nr:hypothetical protein [Sphingobacterium tabacisoli]
MLIERVEDFMLFNPIVHKIPVVLDLKVGNLIGLDFELLKYVKFEFGFINADTRIV